MNKKTLLLALALMCGTGLVTSCGGDDDDPQPNDTNDTNTTPQRTSVYGAYVGWSKATVHGTTIKTPAEQIEITKVNDNTVNISYVSPTWGTATLSGVQMTKIDQGYTLSKPITVEENEEHTDWIFPENVDYISMTQRGPAAGSNPTTKNYPFVLEKGFISANFNSFEFGFAAYLKLTGAGIYRITFLSGEVEPDAPVIP